MPVFKKLKEFGGSLFEESKKDWQALKKQVPKAKENVRRARRTYRKFAKGAKKVHSEGRKALKEFQESLPKVPDDYFDSFVFGSEKKRKKRR